MTTEKSTRYHVFITKIISNGEASPEDIKECCDLIAELDKPDLDWVATTTIWYWQSKCKTQLLQFLEHLIKRGADLNTCRDNISAIFKIMEYDDSIEIIDALVKLGVDFTSKGKIHYGGGYYTMTAIEYLVYYHAFGDLKIPKTLIKHLLNLGVSHDISNIKAHFRFVTKTELYYKSAKYFIKNCVLEKKNGELEQDLKEAKDYIFELEHRPPELGGPEYEAGLKRWEAHQN